MNYFPDPKEIGTQGHRHTMHQRNRIVIQQASYEDAVALAEELSEKMAVNHEQFIAFCDDDDQVNLGEIVTGRKFYPCKGAMVPAEETEAAK